MVLVVLAKLGTAEKLGEYAWGLALSFRFSQYVEFRLISVGVRMARSLLFRGGLSRAAMAGTRYITRDAAILLTGSRGARLALLTRLYNIASRMWNLERRLWVTALLTWTVGLLALAWEFRKPTWIVFGLLTAHAYSRRSRSFTRLL
jgi:hypothetical protein